MKLTLTRLAALPPVVDGLCRDAENVDLPSATRPASGGLLYAVAMMAAGWDPPSQGYGAAGGGPDKHAPGFPDDGSWVVKWGGLKKAQ